MTFLSLAKGDPAARMLLGNAIKARYGVRPIMPSSLQLDLEARAKGRFGLPITETIRVRYVGITHRRWDQTEKLLFFTTSQSTQSYDGGTLYIRKGDTTASINDPKVLQGVRNQLWLEMALFLTPLTEEDVVLKSLDALTLQASPSASANERVTLHLNTDHTLKAAEGECYDADRKRTTRLTIRPADGLRAINDFAIPVKFVYEWEGELPMAYSVLNAQADPKIPLTEFSIG